jgi:hypothetical protein
MDGLKDVAAQIDKVSRLRHLRRYPAQPRGLLVGAKELPKYDAGAEIITVGKLGSHCCPLYARCAFSLLGPFEKTELGRRLRGGLTAGAHCRAGDHPSQSAIVALKALPDRPNSRIVDPSSVGLPGKLRRRRCVVKDKCIQLYLTIVAWPS